LVKSINCGAPHDSVFSTPAILLPPTQVQIFSLAPCSQTPWNHLTWETWFHTNQTTDKIMFLCILIFMFLIKRWKDKTIPNQILASLHQINLNFFMNVIFICYCFSLISESCPFSNTVLLYTCFWNIFH
jgi:hypothetical protein